MINELYLTVTIEGDIDKVPPGGAMFQFAGTVPALLYLSDWLRHACSIYTAEMLMLPEAERERAKAECEFSVLNKARGTERIIWRIVLQGNGQFNFGLRAKRKIREHGVPEPPDLQEALGAVEQGAQPAESTPIAETSIIPILYILASYDTASLFRKCIDRVFETGEVGYSMKIAPGETVEESKWLASVELAPDLVGDAESSVGDLLSQLNISVIED